MLGINTLVVELNNVSIPCRYLDYIIIALTLINLVSRFLGYEFSNFYYVTFFGLFPYRLYKEIFERSPMSFVGAVLLFIEFCLMWKYINRVIPFVFNSYLGQTLLSLSLVGMDRFFFFHDLFGKNYISRYFFYISIMLAIGFYWLYLGQPSFFLMALFQTMSWFTNFTKHFLQSKNINFYIDSKLGDASPNLLSDFKWGNLVDLMSLVSITKHGCPISNSLGSWFNNLRYSNIAKRYFPVNDSASEVVSNVKTIVPVVAPALGGSVLVGAIEKLRMKNIENNVLEKKKLDAVYKENIKSSQEELEENLIYANSSASSWTTIKHELEVKGFKNQEAVYDFENLPLNTETNINNFEIKELLLELKFFRIEYVDAVALIKRLLLRKVCNKKIIECDVKIIKPNLIQKIFSTDNKTFYINYGLGLNPETLMKKAEKNSKIQALLKKELPTEGCPLLNMQKIEKLSDKIYPLLDPVFKEIQLEFQNEIQLNLQKQRDTTLDLEEEKTNIFFGSKDLG